jgi:hypothetical protein
MVPVRPGSLCLHGSSLSSLRAYSHAIPAMQEEAAALIAGLVFAARVGDGKAHREG